MSGLRRRYRDGTRPLRPRPWDRSCRGQLQEIQVFALGDDEGYGMSFITPDGTMSIQTSINTLRELGEKLRKLGRRDFALKVEVS